MPLGLNLLMVMGTLVIFGATSGMLRHIQIPRWLTLTFIAAAFSGALIPPIPLSDSFLFNLGGAGVPIAFSIYLFIRLKGMRAKSWLLFSCVVTAAGVFVLNRLVIQQTDINFTEPMYISAIFAAVLANVLCKNLKGILICAVSGVLLAGLISFFEEGASGGYAYINWGSYFEFDCVMITIISSMLLARASLLIISMMQRRHAKKADILGKLNAPVQAKDEGMIGKRENQP
jgi:hypothetical protein